MKKGTVTLTKLSTQNDTFFYAITKALNSSQANANYTEKELRQVCYNFYMESDANKAFIAILSKQPQNQIDYTVIQYTEEELNATQTTAINGRPDIEGVILCKKYPCIKIINPEMFNCSSILSYGEISNILIFIQDDEPYLFAIYQTVAAYEKNSFQPINDPVIKQQLQNALDYLSKEIEQIKQVQGKKRFLERLMSAKDALTTLQAKLFKNFHTQNIFAPGFLHKLDTTTASTALDNNTDCTQQHPKFTK